MNRAFALAPLIVLLGLAGLGAAKLIAGKGEGFGRSDGRPAPVRHFQTLGEEASFAVNPNPDGEARLVNLFASWCAPCVIEHPLLMALAERHPGRLIGILYEDTPENGARFLAERGNPFSKVGLDPDGQGGLDFGLTGVPESFVINGEGEIVLHIRGPLDEESLRAVDRFLTGP